MSKDLEELEAELFTEDDDYIKGVKEKTNRKMLVSNFLESKEQSKVSKTVHLPVCKVTPFLP